MKRQKITIITNDRLLNFNETRKYLNVSRATLYRYIYERKIPVIKMLDRWRFDKRHLTKWLEDQIVPLRGRRALKVKGNSESRAYLHQPVLSAK